MIRDADRFKMDLVGGLERTLHGEIKPSMRPYQMFKVHAYRYSDHAMLDAPSLRRCLGTRRLIPYRQSQNLRAKKMRSPPRRLPRATQYAGMSGFSRRPQGQQDEQEPLCCG